MLALWLATVSGFGQVQEADDEELADWAGIPLLDLSNYQKPQLSLRSSESVNIPITHYDQGNYTDKLGSCSSTISAKGCAVACMSMLLSAKNIAVSPNTLNTYLKNNSGYQSGCNIVWGKAASYNNSGITVEGYTNEYSIYKIKEELDAGNPVIIHGRGSEYCSHYVICYGYNNGGKKESDFIISDPGNFSWGGNNLANYTTCTSDKKMMCFNNVNASISQPTPTTPDISLNFSSGVEYIYGGNVTISWKPVSGANSYTLIVKQLAGEADPGENETAFPLKNAANTNDNNGQVINYNLGKVTSYTLTPSTYSELTRLTVGKYVKVYVQANLGNNTSSSAYTYFLIKPKQPVLNYEPSSVTAGETLNLSWTSTNQPEVTYSCWIKELTNGLPDDGTDTDNEPGNALGNNGLNKSSASYSLALPTNLVAGRYLKIFINAANSDDGYGGSGATYYIPIKVDYPAVVSAPTINTDKNSYVQGETITVNGTASGVGYKHSDFYLKSSTVEGTSSILQNTKISSNTPSCTFSTSTLAPGTYYIYIVAWFNGNPELLKVYKEVEVTAALPTLAADQYESNNSQSAAHNFNLSWSNNTATVNSTGSNFHTSSDVDYYKITLPSGYNYTITPRLHDSYSSGNAYTVEGKFSHSVESNSYSTFYRNMCNDINISGGNTIYFKVEPLAFGNIGSYLFTVNITRSTVVAPITNPCSNCTTMQCAQPYNGTLSTSGVWDNYYNCSWNEPGEEKVYCFTPSTSDSYTFTATANSGYPDFFLMSACGKTTPNISWNDGNKVVSLSAGTTYYLIVDNSSNTNSAKYTIKVACPTETSTGTCKTVPKYDHDITPSTSWVTATSRSIESNGCKVYRFSATAGEKYSFATNGSNGSSSSFDSQLLLYNSNGNKIEKKNDSGSGEIIENWECTSSGDYYLQVKGYSSYYGNYTLAYRKTLTVSALPNDICSSAIDLSYGATSYHSTVGATAKTIQGNTASPYGVWYYFIGDGRETTISSSADFDHALVLFSGSCNNLIYIDNNDDNNDYDSPNGYGSAITFSATSGVRYYVYVAHCNPDGNETQTGSFIISRTFTQPVYTITLDKQEGRNGTSTVYEKYDTGWDTSNSGTFNFSNAIEKPTRTGYTFGGYYTSTNGNGTLIINSSGTMNGLATVFSEDNVLYAHWYANTYTVRYNGNDNSSGSTSSSSHTYNELKSLTLNEFTRTGYTFAGWATSASGSVTYSNGQSVSNLTPTNGDIVNLYAVWTKKAPSLIVRLKECDFFASKESIRIGVTSNQEWTAFSNKPSWLSCSPNNGYLIITVEENTSTNPRSGTITISSGDETHEITITQDAGSSIPIGTAIDDIATQGISIFPNPVKDVLHIASTDVRIEKAEICDASGRVVQIVSAESLSVINVSLLPQGLYFLKIYSSNGLTSHKFIKE